MDPIVALAGLLVGFVVGLTGMGGGALMTPILVLLFGVEPLTAVSSDIVASMIMKPIGGGVHWKRGTVHRGLVKWLVMGSVPSAFLGVLLLKKLGSGSLMIILLLMLYPRLKLSELVGTDLVQAVPLVTSAALGHLLFGDFKMGLTASILIGSVPGVFLGARFSSRAPDYLIRPALIVVLLLSGMKLVGTSNRILATV